MTEIYGHKWLSSFGEVDHDDTWARGLYGVLPEEIANGLGRCFDREDPWPPTLIEFRRLCKPKDEKPVYHETYKELPAPNLTKEEKLKWVEACRKALG